jgi:S-adenosylmethionine-dependent methyltransferase
MSPKHPPEDRNFDDLATRFQNKIYDSMKGRLRLAILRRDFAEHVVLAGMRALDIGAGQGQWAMEMLRRNASVHLTDVSAEMLGLAQSNVAQADITEEQRTRASFQQIALQEIAGLNLPPFDVMTCHAVLEWLDQPEGFFAAVDSLLVSGGWCSLIFYNVNGLIFKNLLRTNYKKVMVGDFRGARGGLTPLNPLRPEQVIDWAEAWNYEVVCHSGIRVFHDYVLDKRLYEKDPDVVENLELQYSRQPPYRDLGRYVHLLLRKRT